ncbi:P-loop containing nucleoside triphosphate hydrolase protein [Mycena galopus ATCC 62051]|nr:P-loop containing nucleoside triphosphate hydrolase protein [Mycena galopus ATCC 62051]
MPPKNRMLHPRTLAERLSHLFYTVFSLANTSAAESLEIMHPTTGVTISAWPPWIQALLDAKIPFFWASDHTRDELRHEDIRVFDWGASEALLAVVAANKIHHWDRLWDPLFSTELDTRDRTVHQVWLALEDKMPCKGDWDALQPAILTSVFGPAIATSQIRFPQPSKTYWSFWISAEINSEHQRSKRGKEKLVKLRKKLHTIFGPEFMNGGDDVAAAFSVTKSTRVFELLTQYHIALAWTPLLEADISQLMQPVESPTSDALRAQYAGLSDNAQAHEFCGRSLGWMSGMLTVKGERAHIIVPDLSPEMLAAFHRGSALADTIPQRLRQALADVSQPDLVAYQEALTGYTDVWMGRDAPLQPDTVLDVLSGTLEKSLDVWFAGGADIGNEAFKKAQPHHLLEYLGLTSDTLPLLLRRHVADDHMVYESSKDIPLASTKPLELGYHQLQAVAVIISKMKDPTLRVQKELVPKHTGTIFVPQALKEGWTQVPAVLLTDEVGLGKTLTCFAAIAEVVHLREMQQAHKTDPERDLPACLGSLWGCVPEIPDAPHLIVVPLSLMKQFESEIKRFFNDAWMSLIVVRSPEKHWKADFLAYDAAPHPPYRRIILTSHPVITRMARNSTATPVEQSRVRVCLPLSPPTLFSKSYNTLVIDEAHQLRTGGAAWRSIDGIALLALLKLFMTATPLIEGPRDILNLALLCRPPRLGDLQASQLYQAIVKLNSTKRLLRLQDTDALLKFHEGGTTGSTRADSGDQSAVEAIDGVATGIVKQIQGTLMTQMIRRTGASVDHNDKPISLTLPPLTVVHMVVKLTAEEVDGARLFEREEETDQSMTKLDKVKLSTHTAFYAKARAHISLPRGHEITAALGKNNDLSFHNAPWPLSKLAALTELITSILIKGPEAVVPEALHSTTTHIVDQSLLGIQDVSQPGFKPTPFPQNHDTQGIQICVYTLLAQYHPLMLQYLHSHGINAIAINGNMTPSERHERIERFKGEKTIHVLIMSGVGITGLNLTNAMVMIAYEVAWSTVMSTQAYGRIHRKGQKRRTFAIQMVAQDTVDVLLATIGLGKAQMATQFITMDRVREFYTPFLEAVRESENLDKFELPVHETALVSQDTFKQIPVQVRKAKKQEKKAKAKGLSLASPSDDTTTPSDPPSQRPGTKTKRAPESNPPLVSDTQGKTKAKQNGKSVDKSNGKEKPPSASREPTPIPKTPEMPHAVALAIAQSFRPSHSTAGSSNSVGPSIPASVLAEQEAVLDSVDSSFPMSIDSEGPSSESLMMTPPPSRESNPPSPVSDYSASRGNYFAPATPTEFPSSEDETPHRKRSLTPTSDNDRKRPRLDSHHNMGAEHGAPKFEEQVGASRIRTRTRVPHGTTMRMFQPTQTAGAAASNSEPCPMPGTNLE